VVVVVVAWWWWWWLGTRGPHNEPGGGGCGGVQYLEGFGRTVLGGRLSLQIYKEIFERLLGEQCWGVDLGGLFFLEGKGRGNGWFTSVKHFRRTAAEIVLLFFASILTSVFLVRGLSPSGMVMVRWFLVAAG